MRILILILLYSTSAALLWIIGLRSLIGLLYGFGVTLTTYLSIPHLICLSAALLLLWLARQFQSV